MIAGLPGLAEFLIEVACVSAAAGHTGAYLAKPFSGDAMGIVRRLVSVAAVVAGLACATRCLCAQDLPLKNYPSPSAQMTLTIDPSERSGAGPAMYTLRRRGTLVWTGERPFTLWRAVVADDGTVAGYAYGKGYDRDDGDFVVVILDAGGGVRLAEKTPRQPSHFLHTMGNPKANGLFIDAANNRFVVRVDDAGVNAGIESWWTYRLDDGHPSGKFKPRDLMPDAATIREMIDARPVAGTPLTLLQWLRRDCASARCAERIGVRFTLVDLAYKPVWTLDLDEDYTNRTDDKAQDRLLEEIRSKGAILDSSTPARFELREVAAARRVTFAVERDAQAVSHWNVRETASSPYVASAKPVHEQDAAIEVALRKVGSLQLGAGKTTEASPIPDVYEFAVGEGGRFAFVVGCGCDEAHDHALLIVDGDGRLSRKIALPALPEHRSFTDHVAWLGGERWLVTTSETGEATRSSAVRVDATDGTITPLAAFAAPQIESLAALRDGGFVALTAAHSKYSIIDVVMAFDADGKPRWEVGEGQEEGKLFSPQGIAVTTTGEVVVLENIRNQLKIYAADGSYRRSIDLAVAWGRQPNYPSGIAADASGGVIVHDFHGKPPIVQMTLDGKVASEFTPMYVDGREFDIHGHVQAAPGGSLWTSDGRALLRLDAAGKVEFTLGVRPDADVLGDIATLTVTPKGRIYAVDARTGAVHVFDAEGARLHICRPQVGDYRGELRMPSLTVSDSGDVYVARNDDPMAGAGLDFLHYDAAGLRIGAESVKLHEVDQRWLAQPGSTNRWILGYTNAYLVDAGGNVVRKLDRTAQRQWLEHPDVASASTDGAVAIASGGTASLASGSADASSVITLFSAAGDPLDTWPAPKGLATQQGSLAFDRVRLAFLVGPGGWQPATAAVVTDLHGKALFRYTPAPGHSPRGVFFVQAAEGPELWFFDGRSTMDRYQIP